MEMNLLESSMLIWQFRFGGAEFTFWLRERLDLRDELILTFLRTIWLGGSGGPSSLEKYAVGRRESGSSGFLGPCC